VLSGPSKGFQCKCGASITSVSSAKCDHGNYQIYKHSDVGYASQLPRKRLRERLEQEALLKHAHCPNGLTACNVEGAPDAFEVSEQRLGNGFSTDIRCQLVLNPS
jgi:hypothetical protein